MYNVHTEYYLLFQFQVRHYRQVSNAMPLEAIGHWPAKLPNVHAAMQDIYWTIGFSIRTAHFNLFGLPMKRHPDLLFRALS